MKTKVFYFVFFVVACLATVFFLISFFDNYYYPLRFKTEILNSSKEFNVKPEIIASVINIESSFYEYAVSSKGAVGLMQLMPSTASWLSEKLGEPNFDQSTLTNPAVNIRLGTYYLKYLIDKFENLHVALCAYNAGEGTVRNWLLQKEYSADGKSLLTTPYNETNNFIKKFDNCLARYEKKFENLNKKRP